MCRQAARGPHNVRRPRFPVGLRPRGPHKELNKLFTHARSRSCARSRDTGAVAVEKWPLTERVLDRGTTLERARGDTADLRRTRRPSPSSPTLPRADG
ncbi:hypothetical protein MHYP_G00286600 [Metynnis hypsauchen]